MKKITILILLSGLFLTSNGQRIDLPKVDTVTVVKDYEMEYIRECLWHYQKQHNLAYMCTTVGAGIILLNIQISDNSKSLKYSGIIGGAFFVIGTALMIDSEKWIRKAAIKPIPGGIAIRIGKK
jgi:hypothetical protein